MKLNIFMQSNNVKHREKTTSAVLFDVRALILTLVITMTMVMGTALFTNSIAYAQSGDGATVRVATFDQLNDALANGGVSDIIIDPQAAEEFVDNEDAEIDFDGSDVFYIPIEYPLVVSHDVTISSELAVNFARSGNGGSGKYDSKTFRGQNEVTPALFNIDQGKTLELSGDIAMTGEEVSATFDSAEGSFLFTVKSRDNLGDDEDDNAAWSYGSDPGNLAKGGYFIYTKGGNVVMNDGILLMGLNTQDNVKDIAPVYIDGTAKAATLTVDGAEIVDNNLGQTEDGNSTAGAVILKGSNATAALNSGEISNNNADVAGIIVKEEAELELGRDFGINDSDIYDEKAEEAAEEETAEEEATEEEATEEKAAEEETKEEVKEETPVAAPKKSLKSMKSPATQMRSAGNVVNGVITVSTSAQLKAALANDEVNTIILDKKSATVENTTSNPNGTFYLTVDEPLTVSRAVTIKTKDSNTEVIIARSEKFKNKVTASNPAIFNVSGSGHLTLSSKITMTGDEVKNETEAVNLQLVSDSGKYYGVVGGDAGKLKTFSIVSSSNDRVPMYIDSNGYILINYRDESTGTIKTGGVRWLNLLREAYPGNTDYRLVELDQNGRPGAFASSLSSEKTYVISVGSNKFLRDDIGGATDPNVVSNALKLKAVPDGSTSGSGAGLKYKFTVDHKDGTSGNTAVWTKGEVKEGGYFIHSTNGGIVDIQDGVTLQGLNTKTAFTNGGRETKNGVEYWTYTDDTVTNVAPIYIGGGSTLNMSGGTIQNNRVGYGADENDSSSSIQWLKRRLSEEAFPTNTAGGIIATGDGTTVNITSKAKISNNQADAGALIIKDNALVTMDKVGANKPEISSNIGWHHSGGALVESGATLHLIDGKINDNIAWGKGGAVWATEWGTNGWPVWDNYPNTIKNTAARQSGGNFIMDGGELSGNFAFTRGGAIEVESNGVTLNGGDITGNRCKSLGGAMYIEGDSPIYTYTVVIQKGFISGNTAVSGANSDLDKRIDGNKLAVTDPNKKYNPYHYDKDFAGWQADGDGGGVWLCSMGGTSVFTSDENDANQQVVIDNNTAGRSGDDFFVSAKKGAALIQNLLGVWYYDTGNAENPLGDRVEPEGQEIDPATGKVIYGRKGLVNGTVPNYTSGLGIQITGNKARDGGGIACNGTIVLGEPQNVYRYETELELTKTWETGLTPEEVTLQLYYEYPKDSGNWHQLTAADVKYEVDLGDSVPDHSGDDQTGPDSDPAATNVIYQTEQWKARASIPSFTQHTKADGTVVEVPLYKIKKAGTTNEYYDLVNSKSDIEALYAYYKQNPNAQLEVEWNIQVREKNNKFDPRPVGDTTATSDPNKTKKVSTVTVKDSANESVRSFSVYYTSVTLNQTVKNYPKGTKLKLFKKDRHGRGIAGVNFVLAEATRGGSSDYRFIGGENEWKASPHDKTYEHNDVKFATATSAGNDGHFEFEGLKPGSIYFLFESNTPEDYSPHTAPWLVQVANNGSVTVRAIRDDYKTKVNYNPGPDNGPNQPEAEYNDKKVWHRYWKDDWFEPASASSTTLINDLKPIKLTKVEGSSPTNLTTSEKISGAKFRVYHTVKTTEGGTTKWTKDEEVAPKNELISDSNGDIFLPSAVTNTPGNDNVYWLEEVQAAPGYVKNEAPWLIWIQNGNYIAYRYANLSDITNDGKTVTYGKWTNLEGEYRKYVFNKPLIFKKVSESDADWTLSNVKFQLYEAMLDGSPATAETLNNVSNWSSQSENDYHLYAGDRVGENVTIKSGADGTFTLPINKAGVYLLFEEAAVSGHERMKAPWLIAIANDGSVTFASNTRPDFVKKGGGKGTINNDDVIVTDGRWWPLCYYEVSSGLVLKNKLKPIELYKVDETDDANRLGGAEFVICEAERQSNNNYWIKAAKDSNGGWIDGATVMSTAIKENGQTKVYTSSNEDATKGKIVIDDLEGSADGKYYLLFEKTAPTGFVRSTSPWIIKVTDTSAGRNVVVKRIADSSNQGKVLVPGGNDAVNWIIVPDSTSASDQTVKERWWSDAWYETFESEPYNLANEPKYLTKVDLEEVNKSDPTGLPNAEFTIYKAKDGTGSNAGRYSRDTWSKKLTSDSNGKISLPSSITKTSGKYLLFEDTPPGGYRRANKPWLLVVNSSGEITVKYIEEKVSTTDTSDGSVTSGGIKYWKDSSFKTKGWSTEYRIPNTSNPVSLTKVDGYSTSKKLKGAIFDVYGAVGVQGRQYRLNTSDYKGETSESDDNGIFTLPELKTGLYFLKEKQAPKNYVLSDKVWLLQIAYSSIDGYYLQNAWVYTLVEGQSAVYNWEGDCGSGYVKNYPAINLTKLDLESTTKVYDSNGRETVSLNTDNPTIYLEGVKFKLYNAKVSSNNPKTATWEKRNENSPVMVTGAESDGTIKTDANGVLNLGNLANGNYLLEETEAKTGYNLPEHPWRLVVNNGTVKVYVPSLDGSSYIETAHNKYLTNVQIYDLPKTGGMGTYWFMIIGALLMGFAVTAGFTKMDLLSLFRR